MAKRNPAIESWMAMRDAIAEAHGLSKFQASYHPAEQHLSVDLISVPDGSKGEGHAAAAMKDTLDWADAHGVTVTLSPTAEFGASKKRLERWYRSMGFVPNKGRNKDFRFTDAMLRPPKESTMGNPKRNPIHYSPRHNTEIHVLDEAGWHVILEPSSIEGPDEATIQAVRLIDPDNKDYFALITRSARDPGQWQATRFDERGPVGHTTSDTLIESLNDTRKWYGLTVAEVVKKNPGDAQPTDSDEPSLFHVTYVGRLPGVVEDGLAPGRSPSIGGTSYDWNRRESIFLSESDGVSYWYDLASRWAFDSSDEPSDDGLVPVVLRISGGPLTTELGFDEFCEDDEVGWGDSNRPTYKCKTTIDPKYLQVWTGSSWVPVRDYDQVDLSTSFDMHTWEDVLLPSDDEMAMASKSQSANPRKRKPKRKTPEWKRLLDRSHRLWETYDAKPLKKNLAAFGAHIEKMKTSASLKVKTEARRAERAFNAEFKARGWKR